MNMLIYLILVNLCLAACYGFYYLFLRHETFHHANRWFLLGGIVAAYILPVLQSEWVQSLFITQKVQASVQATEVYQLMLFLPQQNEPGLTWSDVLLGVYIAGFAFGMARLGWMFYQLKKQAQNEQAGEAWSFFGWRKIDPKLDGQTMILKHETVHSRQGHSFDVLLAELLIILNWFNPVVYLIRISLRRLHEFMADAEASKQDKASYAMLLLSRQFAVNPSVLAHSFMDMKQLKHRIMMMKKDPSRKSALLKYGLLLPLFGSILILSAATSGRQNPVMKIRGVVEDISDKEILSEQDTTPVQKQNSTSGDILIRDVGSNGAPVHYSVDKLPEPPAGQESLAKYIAEHYRVPEEIKKSGMKTGRITVSFVVETSGKLSNIKVLRDLGYGTGEEAKRVLENMPAWRPGLQNKKPVRVAYTLPISITVDNTDGRVGFAKKDSFKTLDNSFKTLSDGFKGDPLYVIDGVEKTDSKALSGLNPDRIESINVLKDSAAVKLYGEKGKNGVILITTKKNKSDNPGTEKTDSSGGTSSKKSGPNEEVTVIGYPSTGTNKFIKKSTTPGKPLKAVTVVGYSSGSSNGQQQNMPMSFVSVDVLPAPQGGQKGFMKYVRDNYRVPEAAAKSKSDGGRITVSFVVEINGDLTDIKVLRDLGYGTGEEAVRMLKSMPPWKPGIQKGKPVRVAYTLPIAVSLK